jgi:cytidylate kinase
MTEYIQYGIDTIRKRIMEEISKALDRVVDLSIKKVYKENKNIVVEGKYETYFFNEKGDFKIVFDEYLNLVNFEVT